MGQVECQWCGFCGEEDGTGCGHGFSCDLIKTEEQCNKAERNGRKCQWSDGACDASSPSADCSSLKEEDHCTQHVECQWCGFCGEEDGTACGHGFSCDLIKTEEHCNKAGRNGERCQWSGGACGQMPSSVHANLTDASSRHLIR